MNDLVIYSNGLCCCSVCTDIEDLDELTRRVNEENPTGVESQWSISEDTHFRQGQPNPCQCEKDSNRKHYLFTC